MNITPQKERRYLQFVGFMKDTFTFFTTELYRDDEFVF